MALLTLEELKNKHPESQAKKLRSLDDIQSEARVTQATSGNQFDTTTQPAEFTPQGTVADFGTSGGEGGVGAGGIGSFFGKTRDFLTDVVGGGKVAEGLGEGIAAPKLQRQLSEVEQSMSDTDLALIKRINEKKEAGEDTTRLENARTQLLEDIKVTRDVQTDFVESLPSNQEVVGSAVRLGATLVAPTIGGKAVKATQLGRGVTGVGSGIARGAGAGAIGGAIEGGLQGVGLGIEQEKDLAGVATSAVTGAAIGGVAGGVIGGAVGGVSTKIKANQAFKEETSRLLTESPDSTVAKFKLSGEGQIVNDKVAQEAIKQGFDDGVVATVKGSSVADKTKMGRMVDILEQGKKNPKFAATNRPSDVIGDSVLERFKVVNTANKTAGKELGVVAKGLKGQTADFTPAVNTFIEDLDDLGVKIINGKPEFSGSQIEDLAEPQKIVNTIVKRMNTVSDDAFEIHNLKKFIDEQVTFGKTSGGLTGRTEGILKGLRANLDEVLDANFADYSAVNTTFATTRNAMDDFMTAAGSRFNPSDANANARIGTLSRRILSNAQSRTEVLNAMQGLQTVAEANGGKFTDDIITQTVFVNDLERLLGTSAPTSLAGEVQKGVARGGTIAGKLKSSQGLFDLALEATGAGIEKARGISDEGLINSVRALLQ